MYVYYYVLDFVNINSKMPVSVINTIVSNKSIFDDHMLFYVFYSN